MGRTRIAVEDVATLAGTCQGVKVWTTIEESRVTFGPPRSGKGVHVVINSILDAPGAVVTTSTRLENYAMTALLREQVGDVIIFDPQNLSGLSSDIRWSPIFGCEDQLTAAERASSIIGASGIGQSSGNQEWAQAAEDILKMLLHAAAIGGRDIGEFALWCSSPTAAAEAEKILLQNSQAAPGWGLKLAGVRAGDPKLAENKWFGVSGAVSGLDIESVRAAMSPASREDQFDVERFLTNRGTLYIIGDKSGGGAVGPFLISLMDSITKAAMKIAQRSPGNRMDPPLSLVLDEIANISDGWKGLGTLMTAGGGSGISTHVIFQTEAQAKSDWGEHAAQTIMDGATVTQYLGGARNVGSLSNLVQLLDKREVVTSSKSSHKGGDTINQQIGKEDVISVDEVRRLPFGYSIYLARNARAAFVHMRPWKDRDDAQDIRESIKRTDKQLADVGAHRVERSDDAFERMPQW